MLVVISDGADNASAHSLEQVLQMAERSSAIIYTVGVLRPTIRTRIPKCSLAWHRRRVEKLSSPADPAR